VQKNPQDLYLPTKKGQRHSLAENRVQNLLADKFENFHTHENRKHKHICWTSPLCGLDPVPMPRRAENLIIPVTPGPEHGETIPFDAAFLPPKYMLFSPEKSVPQASIS